MIKFNDKTTLFSSFFVLLIAVILLFLYFGDYVLFEKVYFLDSATRNPIASVPVKIIFTRYCGWTSCQNSNTPVLKFDGLSNKDGSVWMQKNDVKFIHEHMGSSNIEFEYEITLPGYARDYLLENRVGNVVYFRST